MKHIKTVNKAMLNKTPASLPAKLPAPLATRFANINNQEIKPAC